jgi:hypothetical protein
MRHLYWRRLFGGALAALLIVPLLAFAQAGQFAFPDGAAENGTWGLKSMCSVSASAPTYVPGQIAPLSCDTGGNLRTVGGSGGGSVTIGGMLPPFASTPTFNCGSGCFQATQPVSAADGLFANLGALADAPWSGAGGGSLTAIEKAIYGAINAPIPCRAASTVPSASADGAATPAMCSTDGKLVVAPFAPAALRVQGSANTTGASAVTLIQLANTTYKIYITGLQCFRTDAGTSYAYLTLNDAVSSVFPLPPTSAGGGFTLGNIASPLVVSAAVSSKTTAQFTVSTSLTSVYCNAQGYQGP